VTHSATRINQAGLGDTPGRRRALRAGTRAAEAGESALTAVFGVGIFLGFLLLASQVMLYLFTATIAQAAAVDGANHGAGAAQVATVSEAIARTKDVLGGLAEGAIVDAVIVRDAIGSGSGSTVRVSVRVASPAITGRFGLTDVRRAATARVER
jgi:hypothetical protein